MWNNGASCRPEFRRGFLVRRTLFALTILAAAVVIPVAGASQVISTSTVTNLTLGVNAEGEAMVNYTSGGKVVHVLAWGAKNAIAPVEGRKQVAFTLLYDGGYQKDYTTNPAAIAAVANLRNLQAQLAKATAEKNNPARYALAPKIKAAYATLAELRTAATDYWKTFTCPKYKGPALADMVTACRAPDGSYWAVQSWDRDLPDYGVKATVAESQIEVHLAHWTGPLPDLTAHIDWGYGGQWHHLWGTYTYAGHPVFGFHSTPAGVPLDTFGRNLYVDTYNSVYGPGWIREASFLTHQKGGGSWCYSVNPHPPQPAGTGSQYRLTILGPGVTPDVSTTLNAPGPYDKVAQEPSNAALLALHDPQCIPHV
jgi:hypothetical protein